MNVEEPEVRPSVESSKRSWRLFAVVAAVMVAWIGLGELVTFAWYRSRESAVPKNPLPGTGEMVMDRLKGRLETAGGQVSERGIGDSAMEILKCGYGRTLMWNGAAGPMAVTILKWGDNSIATGVESMHNPGVCMRAAGWTVGSRVDFGVEKFGAMTAEVSQWEISRGDLQMLAFSAVIRRYVDVTPRHLPDWLNRKTLRPVLNGIRDAPVFIILAYLPARPAPGDAPVREQFRRIMEGVFTDQASVAAGR